MDTTETALVVALGALALGVAIGWHMRLAQKRTRAAGAAPTAMAAPVKVPSRYNVPVASSSSAECGSCS